MSISRVRLASGTGLPLKWSEDSDQRLYAISERGGLLRTNRAVTTCGLPHRPWDIRQTKETLSLDTTSTLLITTAVYLCLVPCSKLRHSVQIQGDEPASK